MGLWRSVQGLHFDTAAALAYDIGYILVRGDAASGMAFHPDFVNPTDPAVPCRGLALPQRPRPLYPGGLPLSAAHASSLPKELLAGLQRQLAY